MKIEFSEIIFTLTSKDFCKKKNVLVLIKFFLKFLNLWIPDSGLRVTRIEYEFSRFRLQIFKVCPINYLDDLSKRSKLYEDVFSCIVSSINPRRYPPPIRAWKDILKAVILVIANRQLAQCLLYEINRMSVDNDAHTSSIPAKPFTVGFQQYKSREFIFNGPIHTTSTKSLQILS